MNPPKGCDMFDAAQCQTFTPASKRLLAPWPASNHSSLVTQHCLNQSLAKHNRKPSQLIENNHHEPKSIASFYMFFAITPYCKPRPAKGGRHELTLEKRRRATAVRLSCQLHEVTGAVDSGRIRGGRRNCEPMAGLAETMGGWCGAGNSRGPNTGGWLFGVATFRLGCVGLRAFRMAGDWRTGCQRRTRDGSCESHNAVDCGGARRSRQRSALAGAIARRSPHAALGPAIRD